MTALTLMSLLHRQKISSLGNQPSPERILKMTKLIYVFGLFPIILIVYLLSGIL